MGSAGHDGLVSRHTGAWLLPHEKHRRDGWRVGGHPVMVCACVCVLETSRDPSELDRAGCLAQPCAAGISREGAASSGQALIDRGPRGTVGSVGS